MAVSKTDKFQKQLGVRLDAICQEQGISFAEMALRCDIDKSILFKITKATHTTVSTLYKISNGLNVPHSKIFDF
jgi:predicted transcriptional regulator